MEFDISKLKGILKTTAEKIDKQFNNNGKIDGIEHSIFSLEAKKLKLANKITAQEYNSVFGNSTNDLSDFNIKEQYICPQDKTYVAPKTPILLEELQSTQKTKNIKIEATGTQDLIRKEVQKYKGAARESDVDYEHWAKVVDTIAERYNVPQEIIVAIIGKETKGTFKSVNSSSGSGPMQITTISINAFFPNASGNWNDIYNKMDSQLLNDILYEKDKDGNLTNKLKYPTPKALRDACAKDDELGVMVGLLTFEMKYTQAVAAKKFKGPSWKTTPLAAEALRNNSLDLSESEIKNCVRTALVNYNGSPAKQTYATQVVDSLQNMNFKYIEFNPLIE